MQRISERRRGISRGARALRGAISALVTLLAFGAAAQAPRSGGPIPAAPAATPRPRPTPANKAPVPPVPSIRVPDAPPGGSTALAKPSAAARSGRPVVAVIDFQSATLTTPEADAFTQAIWSAFYRRPETLTLDLKQSRRFLIASDLYPIPPYGQNVPLGRVAEALRSQYVLTGTVNRAGDAHTIGYSLYSAAQDRPIAAESFVVQGEPNELIGRAPELVSIIIGKIQGKAPAKSAATASAEKKAAPKESAAAKVRAEEAEGARRRARERDTASAGSAPAERKRPAPAKERAKAEEPAAKAAPKPEPKHEAEPKHEPAPAPEPARITKTSEPAAAEHAAATPEPTPAPATPHAAEPEPAQEAAPAEAPETPAPTPTPAPAPPKPAPPKPTVTPKPTATPPPTPTPAPEPPPAPEPAKPAATPAPAAQAEQRVVSDADKQAAAEAFTASKPLAVDSPQRIALLKKASTLNPNEGAYHKALATSYYYAGDYEKCVEAATEATALLPTDSLLFTLLGSAYFESKQFEDARQSQEKALEIDPNNLYSRFNLALSLQAQGSPKAAESWEDFLKRSEGVKEQESNRARAQASLDSLKSAKKP